ncbi:MAG: GatB/YqeY domain-containing protein [Parcubacteria group bacterium]
MTLHTQIKEEIKQAMRDKDAVRLNTLRGLSAAFVNELVAKGRKPDEELADEEALQVISRGVKQRKDSIEQFEKGGRGDLAEDEKKELEILQAYLPAQMSREEVLKFVSTKLEGKDLGKENKGKLMGEIMKELKGRADGAIVKEVVDEALA